MVLFRGSEFLSVFVLLQVSLEKGKTISIVTLAVGDLSSSGTREVFFELNGQLRSVRIQDQEAQKVRAK